MAWNYNLIPDINLHVKGKVQEQDAQRQARTAQELLTRLTNLPGQILADEVGMGKTFVALSVAVSVALQDKKKRPVVIMIPPALDRKWPKDFTVFKENCMDHQRGQRLRCEIAGSVVDFLKLLDDPEDRRNNIIFLKQGAFHRTMRDPLVKLVLIQRALHRRWNIQELKQKLNRFGAQLLRMHLVEKKAGEFILTLLDTDPLLWKSKLVRLGAMEQADDDPVPAHVIDTLYKMDRQEFDRVFELLDQQLPQRETATLSEKLNHLRHDLNNEFRRIWERCIQQLNLRLPLLVLDEAHHLKNAATRFASLFQSEEDAEQATGGQLNRVFERMLFLTATPFQLGHNELINVMQRFTAIDWNSSVAPPGGPASYKQRLDELCEKLDQAQRATLVLDKKWQELSKGDLKIDDVELNVESWWRNLREQPDRMSTRSQQILEKYLLAHKYMSAAQEQLKPMVVRHHRSRVFSDNQTKRRSVLSGQAILDENLKDSDQGLTLQGEALFPFLLAARVTAITPESRPVFAEGLSSSFDAFLRTRQQKLESLVDTDDWVENDQTDPRQDFYLNEIETFLKNNITSSHRIHPKIQATVNKVTELWLKGEKVLVFCHFIATGHALWTAISEQMRHIIVQKAAQDIGCSEDDALEELDRIGDRFDSGRLRTFLDSYVGELLQDYTELVPYREELMGTVRRYIRTPSFLVRFYPLTQQVFNEEELEASFATKDASGQDFRMLLNRFFYFLARECKSEEERKVYMEHLRRIQTGAIKGKTVEESFSDSELQGAEATTRLPNVRLANGAVRQEVRERLMIAFNTPFFPDVLIASSVMAEGVDLHQNCRYIIHHDLCWNPSTLEQRNGRVDRIGCRAEKTNKPIHIYYPYIGETQDEKMYRVVMDRERWFKVVMGEKIKVTAQDTDLLAERIPFPETAAEELCFKLDLNQ